MLCLFNPFSIMKSLVHARFQRFDLIKIECHPGYNLSENLCFGLCYFTAVTNTGEMRQTHTLKKAIASKADPKNHLIKRMTINKIRPRLTRPGYTDDDTLRFIVTKTYVEEGTPMSIIEDDFLHFAIRAGEIWMEPQDGFVRKRPKKVARKTKKTSAVKKAAKKK